MAEHAINHPPVIVVGYSDHLTGGVTQVTRVLIRHMPNQTLHPMLHGYRPRWLNLLRYLASVLSFAYRQLLGRKAITHIIVASQGDVFRAILYIWIARIFGSPACLQYHKSADILFANAASKPWLRLAFRVLLSVRWHCHLSENLCRQFCACIPSGCRHEHRVIPNALEQSWLALRPTDYAQRSLDVVFLGRWSWEKGVDDLQACFATMPTVCCDVYSDAHPAESPSNIRFHDWLPESGVRQVLTRAKLLVLPSYSEAYPTVLLEALACGTPFVASAIAGITDIAVQSSGGFMFPVGDIELFRQRIEAVLASPERWQAMSVAGAEWVKKTHTVERVVHEWQQVYGDLWQTQRRSKGFQKKDG